MITDQEWDTICSLLDEGWHGEFDKASAMVWRPVLDGFGGSAVMTGLGVLIHGGAAHRPSIAELVAAIRKDPGEPDFAEAMQLLAGPGGALRAVAEYVPPGQPGWDEREKRQDEAVIARAGTMHPHVLGFIRFLGLDRLREAVRLAKDPEWGDANRKRLEGDWQRFLLASEGRDVAALTAGRGPGGLRALDPLGALGVAGRPEIEAGS